MTTLLFVFLGLMVVATGTTILAVVRAKDGYEDDSGFHPAGLAEPSAAPPAPGLGDHRSTWDGDLTPAPAPAISAVSDLPPVLLEGRIST